MARTYVYRLAHVQTAAAAGAAELIVPGGGKIVGFHASQIMIGGAGTGFYRSELAINNNSVTNAGVNYPPRNQTVGSHCLSCGNGLVSQVDTGYIPVDVQCNSGDRLSINQTLTGTAAVTSQTVVDVYFMDGSR